MSDVKRYDVASCGDDECCNCAKMEESTNGDYVKLSDYEKLQAELEAERKLARELYDALSANLLNGSHEYEGYLTGMETCSAYESAHPEVKHE